jgi:hypothetical protein
MCMFFNCRNKRADATAAACIFCRWYGSTNSPLQLWPFQGDRQEAAGRR